MNIDYKQQYNEFLSVDERKDIIKRTITELRTGNNLSQKEAAKLLEVSPQAYNAYETGRTTPPIEILVRMSYLYEIPVDVIIDRDNANFDTAKQRKLLESYEKEIKALKEKLSSAKPEEREAIAKFIENIEAMLKMIKSEE